MILADLAARDVLAWTRGHALHPLPERFAGVATDSREQQPGALFVALRGERFDGHDFLPAAAARGATAALVARGSDARRMGILPCIEVEDPRAALGALGQGRRRASTAKVVAVTGSLGKTTVKQMLAAALSPLGPVLFTEGNLNNEIGVPLTLLRLEPKHRAAVIEMGMNHEGEIARLAALAEPEVGLVTNVHGVHLESLGTIERVAAAKGELYRGLPPEGVTVANADDPLVLGEARASGRRIVTFGRGPADVQLVGEVAESLEGIAFRLRAGGRTVEARAAFLGEHNARNGSAAVAGALAAGVPLEAAAAALAAARPARHRLARIELPGGATLLDDCYNASPPSMAAALRTLRRVAGGRRLGAMLGDMLELGPEELSRHRGVGEEAGGLAWLFAFGRRARAIAEGARAAGVPEVGSGEDIEDGLRWVRARLRAGDLVLLKGSRGMRMERFGEALGAPAEGGH